MACILKAPSEGSCGALILTTQERDRQLNDDSSLRSDILNLKNHWLIGLHHNWHDLKFRYDPLFDFSMAGEGDLRELKGIDVPLIPLDACNFVPPTFKPGTTEKFWDVLFVARAVQFKRIPEFLKCVREIYDDGHRYRVMFICPMPPYDPSEEKTVFYKIRDEYDKLFSEAEKDLFTLLTIDYRYPFPFDLDTLAHFYRSSKVFVHTADDERRCRVAAYAWASGIPVVGMECVGSLLPEKYCREPYYFKPDTYRDFPRKIVEAVISQASITWNQSAMDDAFSEPRTVVTLDLYLSEMAGRRGLPYQTGNLFDRDLSIRLGRHHSGVDSPNGLSPRLKEFVRWISTNQGRVQQFASSGDPERAISDSTSSSGLGKILKRLVSGA
jgi:hypothetical protein